MTEAAPRAAEKRHTLVQRQRLPLYVNRFPDGSLTLTCAHCAIDAQLENAQSIALYAEVRGSGSAITWDTDLAPEHLIAAAAHQCMHLVAYQTA
jgi:hypothetical protein